MELRTRITQRLAADFAIPAVACAQRTKVLDSPRCDITEQSQLDASAFRFADLVLVLVLVLVGCYRCDVCGARMRVCVFFFLGTIVIRRGGSR